MIISNTNSAFFERYSAKNSRLNRLSNIDLVKSSTSANDIRSEKLSEKNAVVALADYRSTYIFKDNLGYSANQATKQYVEYSNLEYREKIRRSLGISVYA